MKLFFPNTKETALFLMRRCGYGFERKDPETGEDSFSRRLGAGQFPKFHIYTHKEGDGLFVNLHLDQKKPTYGGSTAHSGEYDGTIVEQEAERITLAVDKAVRKVDAKAMRWQVLSEKKSFFRLLAQKIFRI